MMAIHTGAAEFRQQRGMDVEHPSTVVRERARAELAHVAREDDQVHVVLTQRLEHLGVECFRRRMSARTEMACRDSCLPRAFEHLRVGVIADDYAWGRIELAE